MSTQITGIIRGTHAIEVDTPLPYGEGAHVSVEIQRVSRPVAQDATPDLDRDMRELKDLVESDRVNDARVLVKRLVDRWPDSDRVKHWARVLAPPVARAVPGPPHRSMAAENAWFKSHGHEYPGCWIAVLGDQLLAADPSYKRVSECLEAVPHREDVVVFYYPDPGRWR